MGEGRILGVHVLHDVGDLLGIQATDMLEPDDPAFHSAVVTMRAEFIGEFLEDLMLVLFLRPSEVGGELVLEQFLLPVWPGLEDMGGVVGLECEGGVVRVDHPQVGEQLMQFHDPESVAGEVLPDAGGGEILLL